MMTDKRHLNSAPIKEAIIDLQVVMPDKTNVEELASLYEQFESDYPRKREVQKGEFGFNFDEGQPTQTTVNQSVIGYRFDSVDEKQVVQFRNDGFTFSQLEPYHDWEQMRDEALKLWNIYVNSISPSMVTRLATRYVNVVKLPNGFNLDDYLTAPPAVPAGLNNEIGGFLTRIEMHEPSIGARGMITQTLEKLPKNQTSLVLDIDVFMFGRYELDDDKYLECLEQLRDYKNDIFFASLTEKAMELFS